MGLVCLISLNSRQKLLLALNLNDPNLTGSLPRDIQ